MSKFVIIDGNSIINRAFFGVPMFTNSKGVHTNAIYGFLNILFGILDNEIPDYITVVFDVHQPTFRHKLYDGYKATRRSMPDELREQVPLLKELLNKMNVTTLELAGYEADDIMGTLSVKGEKAGMEVSVISGDRDLLQIVTNHVKVCMPKTKNGQTITENYGVEEVKSLYNVTPKQFIDVKALMGDQSDNIPGVSGIGEKGAVSIISQFGSIEEAYAHALDIKNTRNRNALLAQYDMAKLSKKLATIDLNVPIETEPSQCELKNVYTTDALLMIRQLEFKSMLKRFEQAPDTEKENIEERFITLKDVKKIQDTFDKIDPSWTIGLYLEKKQKQLNAVAVCFSKKYVYYIPVCQNIDQDCLKELLSELKSNGVKFAIHSIERDNDVLNGKDSELFDVSVAAYLLNPLQKSYEYDDLARGYLDLSLPSYEEIFPKEKNNEINDIDDRQKNYACYNAYVYYMAWEILETQLKKEKMFELYANVEIPLSYALYDMKNAGIKVDRDSLIKYGKKLSVDIKRIEQDIYEEAGHTFNINSSKQLGIILFEEMKIPVIKKTKTGYSTSAEVLEKLKPQYPFVEKILEYRQLSKIKSTYVDGLGAYIQDDGRIHGKFYQTVTATGRISSADPNLQNIPVKMPAGRMIRKVFVPKDGFVFVDADYSQIELRILAHMSKDENLIKAYRDSKDIHAATASLVFHVPLNEVTKEQRKNAKAVNFGIIYGISSFGLSNDLSISRKEAEKYIEEYFKSYPGVKKYLDESVSLAKERGYSVTMFGRRRPIPELSSTNYMQRQFGERVAMNAPIQGTAADIMKIAMVNTHEEFKTKRLESRIVLQVHDELLVEAKDEEVDLVKEILVRNMSSAAKLSVPLDIGVKAGINWDEAH